MTKSRSSHFGQKGPLTPCSLGSVKSLPNFFLRTRQDDQVIRGRPAARQRLEGVFDSILGRLRDRFRIHASKPAARARHFILVFRDKVGERADKARPRRRKVYAMQVPSAVDRSFVQTVTIVLRYRPVRTTEEDGLPVVGCCPRSATTTCQHPSIEALCLVPHLISDNRRRAAKGIEHEADERWLPAFFDVLTNVLCITADNILGSVAQPV